MIRKSKFNIQNTFLTDAVFMLFVKENNKKKTKEKTKKHKK